jgi:fatty acid desaturase
MSAPLEIRDPQVAPTYGDGPISRFCKRALFEARDEVFIRLSLQRAIVMPVLMAALLVVLHLPDPRVHVPEVAKLGAMALYLAVWGYLLPPVILMLHNTMHRPFIKEPKWLSVVHPYAMSFFLGIPTCYREHHIGMHHAEDNMQKDLSSTLAYRRDSFLHFLVYFFRFFLMGVFEVGGYLARVRKVKMAKRLVFGELSHYALIAVVMTLDLRFGVAAFLLPFLICRFMMMVGNWGQHAFINTDLKNSGLANAITCINVAYNTRCFNDGYHIGHHLRANRHWTELPGDFEKNIDLYAREGALVFAGLDFFLVSVLLWTGQWKTLARCFVRLDGKERSDDDVIAMLKSRVHPVRSWPAESIVADVANA